MKNIITPKDTEHHIRTYNFRVLTKDILEATKDGREIELPDEPTPPPPPPPPPPPAQPAAAPEPVAPVVQTVVHDEKMLEKLDELSSSVVKLQMQLEKQEADFAARLASELETAKAAAIELGRQQANAEHEAQMASARTSADAAASKLNQVASAFDAMLQKASAELKEMAVMIAKEVINKELSSASAQIAAGYAASLIAQLDKDARARIMVHPNDYAHARDTLTNERISVHADEAISPGCVMLNSDSLNAQISIKDRFAAARALLEG